MFLPLYTEAKIMR